MGISFQFTWNKSIDTREAEEKAIRQEELGKKWDSFVEEDEEYANLLTKKLESEEDPVKVSSGVIDVIYSEGFHVDKYIQMNPDKFANKPEAVQLIEVGKYLASREQPTSTKPVTKQKSKAPKPIKQTASGVGKSFDWGGWEEA